MADRRAREAPELALGAMVELGEQELAARRAEHALKAGQRAIALNNMREDAHRLIVQALAATGRKSEALKHYQGLVALLKRELTRSPMRRPGRSSPDCAAHHRRRDRPPSRRSPSLQPSVTVQPLPAIRSRRPTRSAPQRRAIRHRQRLAGCSERRQLTIMACNIVDSMALSARLDPEHMRDLITAFHKVIDDVVARFDGFVAQHIGDGVLVYFGYPAADEHDTEQAVRAGLAILDAVRTLKAGSDMPLQARVGIATGLVVVGEQLGTGDIAKRVAIGETPNLAARLQARQRRARSLSRPARGGWWGGCSTAARWLPSR